MRISPLVTFAPGMKSFMRLKQRSRVDFPQPEGPMKAVTSLRAMFIVTLFIARDFPYEKSTSCTSMAGYVV